VANQIEDLDITEQVEPVIKAAVSGSLVSLVPGITSISSIVTHSILEGTANAFLTLRVGVVCRTYCGSLAVFDRKSARRHAGFTAATMLGSIVGESAATVAKAILAARSKTLLMQWPRLQGSDLNLIAERFEIAQELVGPFLDRLRISAGTVLYISNAVTQDLPGQPA
jgi:hypothetical protein